METLKVKVVKVLFPRAGQSSRNNWVKLIVTAKGRGDFSVTGNILESEKQIPLTRRTITITGDYDTDPKFQGTFKCTTIEVIPAGDIFSFLNATAKIPKAAVTEMIKKFGDALSSVIEKTPELLLDIKGITPKKLDKLTAVWKKQLETGGLTTLLHPLQVSNEMKSRISQQFGETAVATITADPYSLLTVPGITFDKVDEFGLGRGVPLISQRRARGVCLWGFSVIVRDCGNTAVTPDQLVAATASVAPEIKSSHILAALRMLVADKGVVAFPDGTYSADQYYAIELDVLRFISSRFARNKKKTELMTGKDVAAYIQAKSTEMGFPFSNEQMHAIRIAAGGDSIFAICGHAGTGKSTISKAILDLYVEVSRISRLPPPKIICLALSAVAADRVRQVSGYPASTIHSALGWIPGEDGEMGYFRHNRRDPLEYDIILLDESSMVDSALFRDLLEAVDPQTRFIMLGDDAQLAAIGAADVFRDILQARLVPVIHLDKIFRHAVGSVIPLFADEIRRGLVPEGYRGVFDDFCFEEISDVRAIVDRIVGLAVKAKSWIKDPLRDFQVLSPMNVGALGSDALNKVLQDVFAPIVFGVPLLIVGGIRYQVGDKVVHRKNEEMKFLPADTFHNRGNTGGFGSMDAESMRVSNGSIGIVCHISESGNTLCVQYPSGDGDIVVQYERGHLGYLLGLAYCLSVHRYQGSEAKEVVIPLHSSQARKMLNNRWLYTAVTRAKARGTLVGQSAVFERTCLTLDEAKRQTVLQRLAA